MILCLRWVIQEYAEAARRARLVSKKFVDYSIDGTGHPQIPTVKSLPKKLGKHVLEWFGTREDDSVNERTEEIESEQNRKQ